MKGVENVRDLFFPLMLTFIAFTGMSLFCDIGQRVLDCSSESSANIERCGWYTFPIAVQKVYPILMMGVMEPFELCGIGNIVCTRKASKTVCNLKG